MFDILPNWHPVLVHFTIALLPLAALLHAGSAVFARRAWSAQVLFAARLNLWLGVLLTLATVAAGFYALAHSVHTDTQLATALVHRRAALVTGGAWLALALWDVRAALKSRRPALVFVLLALAAVVPLAGTGWLGAELVYRHAAGVLPQ